MFIPTMERIGLKHIATVPIDTSMFNYHIPVKVAQISTSLYKQPNKQFLTLVKRSNIVYDNDNYRSYFGIKMIFTIDHKCPFKVVTGSRENYHKGPVLSLITPSIICCGCVSSDTHMDRSKTYDMYYEFRDEDAVEEDVTNAVRDIRNKVHRFLVQGVFDEIDIKTFSPYGFINCNEHFFNELNNQYNVDTLALSILK